VEDLALDKLLWGAEACLLAAFEELVSSLKTNEVFQQVYSPFPLQDKSDKSDITRIYLETFTRLVEADWWADCVGEDRDEDGATVVKDTGSTIVDATVVKLDDPKGIEGTGGLYRARWDASIAARRVVVDCRLCATRIDCEGVYHKNEAHVLERREGEVVLRWKAPDDVCEGRWRFDLSVHGKTYQRQLAAINRIVGLEDCVC